MSNLSDFINLNNVDVFKNRIINGGFDVWQRGETNTIDFADQANYPISVFRTADRFRDSSFTLGDSTIGRFTSSKELYNNKNWIKQSVEVGSNGITTTIIRPFVYFLEDIQITDLIGKEVTLSYLFRAKTNGKYSIAIGKSDDKSFTIFQFDYAGNGNEQKVEFTFTVPTDLLNNQIAAARSLELFFNYGSDNRVSDGSNLNNGVYCAPENLMLTPANDFQWWKITGEWIAITEVQLEKGSKSTEFEKRPLSIELTLCKRYYIKYPHTRYAENYAGFSFNNSPYVCVNYDHEVEMRITPTILVNPTANLTVVADNSQYMGANGGMIYGVAAVASGCGIYSATFDAEM